MLKIQDNELIHSYIFRNHMIHGIFDYSNILTIKGGWKSYPSILPETQSIYSSINENDILEQLYNIGVYFSRPIFSSGQQFKEDLMYFFNQWDRFYWSMSRQSKTVTISFCDVCIKEYINKFGYGIFEESWFQDSICVKHNTHLYSLPLGSRSKAIEQLAEVLRGELPMSAQRKSSYWRGSSFRQSFSAEEIYAPCFLRAFRNFIIDVSNTKHAKSILGMCYRSVHQISQRYVLEHVYSHLKNNRSRAFKKYWTQYAQVISVKCGILDKNSFKVDMVKFSKADCRACEFSECVAYDNF